MTSMSALGRQIAEYRESKRFNHHSIRINSIDIRSEGDLLATSGEDDFIHLYDAITGLYKGGATSAKHRVGKICFGGKEKDEVLAASRNAWDHSLRLISVEKNASLSSYSGHRATVNSIGKSPVEDNFFVSAAQDDSIRLWDLRTPSCSGYYTINSPHTAFDPLGVIIACARSVPAVSPSSSSMVIDGEPTPQNSENSSSNDVVAQWNYAVDLFDSRKLDAGPFTSWMLTNTGKDTVASVSSNLYSHKQWLAGEGRIASFEFSSDGRSLLLSSAHASSVFTIDAFSGERLAHWHGRKNLLGDEIAAHFSPDGSLVSTGSSNGDVFVYQSLSGAPVAQLATSSNSAVLNAKFHPSLPYIASTDVHLSFFSSKIPKT